MQREMAVGAIMMIHNKGPKYNMCNYTALCLLPHAFKLLSMCHLYRLLPLLGPSLPGTQAGFLPGRGCRDNTCMLAWTVNWLLERGNAAVVTYIDFKAAFDSLSHSLLISSFQKITCSAK